MDLTNNKVYLNSSFRGINKSEYLYVIVSLLLLVSAGYTKDGGLGMLFIVIVLLPVNKPFLLLPVLFAAAISSNFFVVSFVNNVSFSRIITVIFIVYSLIYFVSSKKYSHGNQKYIGSWMFIILVLFFISTLFSEVFSFTPLFVLSINLVLFYIMSLYILSEAEKKNLMNYMIISASIIGITLIYMLNSGEIIVIEDERISIEGVNANRIAMAIVQIISIYIFVIFILRKKVKLVFLAGIIFLTVGLSFFLLQTGSRTSVLAIFIFLVSIILLYYTGIQRRNFLFGIVLISLIVYGVSELITGRFGLYGVYIRYSFENMLESRGTNRIDNWFLLFKYVIPQNLFIGVGIGSDNLKAALGGHSFATKNAAHNIIIDPLAQTGIFGLLTLWYMFILVLRKSIYAFRNGYILIGLPLSLFLISLFTGLGETMYTTRFIWFAMGLCMMFMPDNYYGQRFKNKSNKQ